MKPDLRLFVRNIWNQLPDETRFEMLWGTLMVYFEAKKYGYADQEDFIMGTIGAFQRTKGDPTLMKVEIQALEDRLAKLRK